MLEKSEVIETPATPIAYIHLTIPPSEMPAQFGAACQELFAALVAQKLAPSGPLTAHHLRRPNATFDFELAVPVASAVQSIGRVQAGHKPVMKVVRTVYHGGYEGLPVAWGEFQSALDAAGHTLTPDFWETYVVGPASSANPADWRTEFARPLRG